MGVVESRQGQGQGQGWGQGQRFTGTAAVRRCRGRAARSARLAALWLRMACKLLFSAPLAEPEGRVDVRVLTWFYDT